MHFRITSSFQRYILIFKWKALHYNSYNNFFSFTFSLYFPFQFLLHYLSVPKQANQERDRQRKWGWERKRERKREKDWIKWEVKKQWNKGPSSKEKSQISLWQGMKLRVHWDSFSFSFFTTSKPFKHLFVYIHRRQIIFQLQTPWEMPCSCHWGILPGWYHCYLWLRTWNVCLDSGSDEGMDRSLQAKNRLLSYWGVTDLGI